MLDASPLALRRQLLMLRASVERAELAQELAALRQDAGLRPGGLFKLLPLAMKAAQLGRSAPSLWQLGKLWRASPVLGTVAAALAGAGRGAVLRAASALGQAVTSPRRSRVWWIAGASAVLGWQLWRAVQSSHHKDTS
jgi:hypothetical protein